MTKGKFGFHRGGGKHEPSPAAGYVQIYVKSSTLSRTPDLAISAHLLTEAEIDDFVNDAITEDRHPRCAGSSTHKRVATPFRQGEV